MTNYSVKKNAVAGTLESSDIQITIEKNDNKGIEIELNSVVEKQYGKQIRKKILETIEVMGLEDVKVIAIDKGALDCTIVARTMAAVCRASDIERDYSWEEIETWNV